MSDNDPDEPDDSAAEDDERVGFGGFVWQTGGETGQPSSGDSPPTDGPDAEADDVPAGQKAGPDGRIWDRIAGKDDTGDGSESPDEPPTAGQSAEGDTDESEPARAWDVYLSQTSSTAGGEPPVEVDTTDEAPGDGSSPSSDRIWRSMGDEDASSRVNTDSTAIPDGPGRYSWIDEREGSNTRSTTGETDTAERMEADDSAATSPEGDASPSIQGSIEQIDIDALGPSVLVLDSAEHETGNEVCARLFQATDRDRFGVVFVTFEQTAAERTAVFKHIPGGRRGPIAALEVGVYGSSASPVVDPEATETTDDVTIRRLSDPANISKLGIMISQLVSEMEPAERPVVVCFHTVTALGSHVDTERLFRFLHILTGFLGTQDVRGHFHVDPSADSHQTVRTIAPLFDSVVHVSPEGEVEVE